MEITTELSDDQSSYRKDESKIIRIYQSEYETCVITENTVYIFEDDWAVNEIDRNEEINKYINQYHTKQLQFMT
jgi:hypothetical protein